MSNYAITVADIGKKYNIFSEVNRYQTLREKIVETFRTPLKTLFNPTGSETFWALRHIDFEVEKGMVSGSDRQERSRQIHLAQDPLPRG